MTRQSWSIGVLCYNEAGTLRQVVTEAVHLMRELSDDVEIIIVDDGSTDGSRAIALALGQEFPEVNPLLHERNKGIGEALHTFYSNASKELVMMIPGDGQFDLNELKSVGEVPARTIVSFYRKVNTTYSLYRNVLSLFNKKLNEWLTGLNLKDVNWVKIYRLEDLRSVAIELRSSLLESEIVAKLTYLGVRVRELESKYLPRTHGVSKGSSWKIVRKALQDTVLLAGIMQRFRKQHKK